MNIAISKGKPLRHHVLPRGLRRFMKNEASGGVVLLTAALLALAIANPPMAEDYIDGLHWKAGPMSILHWVNDGLMALFFLLVGWRLSARS